MKDGPNLSSGLNCERIVAEKGLQWDQAALLSATVLSVSLVLSFTKSLEPLCSFTAARLKILFFRLRASSPKTDISKNEELYESLEVLW